MFQLDGKPALVTGASGGIGDAIARALHAQGAVVVLSGTRRDALDSLAAELGERTFVCPADLGDAAAAETLVEAAEQVAGPLWALVNNAGMTRDMLALRMSDADWQTVLDVDLSAPFRLARAALRGMLRRRAGRIINISSIVGATGNAGQANYAAAKAGLIGMTKTIAVEVARRDVTVNAIAPGLIETDMTHGLGDELLNAIPARRAGSPQDVAACARFLASEEAGYITGSTLYVDGGLSA